MAEHAPDFDGSLVELVSMIHRVAVAQAIPDALDNSWGDAERVAQLAKSISAEDAQLYYQVAINGKRDMPFAADPRSGFEMILLRMIAFRPVAVLDENLVPEDLKLAPSNESQSVAVEVDPAVKKPREASLAPTLPAEAVQTNRPEPQLKAKLKSAPEPRVAPVISDVPTGDKHFSLEQLSPRNWPALLEQLGLHGIVYNIASHCELRSCNDSTLVFVLDENNASLFNEKHRSRITIVLENYFETKLSVSVDSGEPLTETPAMQKTRLAAERQREAVIAIESDPILQQLIERFDGELVRSSIVPVGPLET
jgi:DNA polymerase-3 subunit gamma/tau